MRVHFSKTGVRGLIESNHQRHQRMKNDSVIEAILGQLHFQEIIRFSRIKRGMMKRKFEIRGILHA